MQADNLDRNPSASATFTLIRSIDAHSKRVSGVSVWALSGEQARAALIFQNFISHSTLMIRRSRTAGPVCPPDHRHCEDYRLITGTIAYLLCWPTQSAACMRSIAT